MNKKKNFTYYPYKPVRKCLSPLKGIKNNHKIHIFTKKFIGDLNNNANAINNTPVLLKKQIKNNENNEENYKEIVKTERILHKNYGNTDSSPYINKTTLKDLRSKYSKYLTNEFNRENRECIENIEKNENSPNFIKNSENERFSQETIDSNKKLSKFKEIADFFNFVINSEVKIELYKKEISLRPDFNLIDLFMFFDKEKKGYCNLQNFIEILKEIGISIRKKDALLFFKRFDRNNNRFLKFSDFSDAFCPHTKENFNLLNQRKPINNDEKFRLKEV